LFVLSFFSGVSVALRVGTPVPPHRVAHAVLWFLEEGRWEEAALLLTSGSPAMGVIAEDLGDVSEWDRALIGFASCSQLAAAVVLLKEMRTFGLRAGREARDAIMKEAARVGDPRPSLLLLGESWG